ncbi:transposase [Aeribacillus sp. FSL K6-2848]
MLYHHMHQTLLKQPILHADETTLQVLRESGRDATSKSYMGYTEREMLAH